MFFCKMFIQKTFRSYVEIADGGLPKLDILLCTDGLSAKRDFIVLHVRNAGLFLGVLIQRLTPIQYSFGTSKCYRGPSLTWISTGQNKIYKFQYSKYCKLLKNYSCTQIILLNSLFQKLVYSRNSELKRKQQTNTLISLYALVVWHAVCIPMLLYLSFIVCRLSNIWQIVLQMFRESAKKISMYMYLLFMNDKF